MFTTVPWVFGVSDELRYTMRQKAHELDHTNPLYYDGVYRKDPKDRELLAWANLIKGPASPLHSWIGKGGV